ncbi:hypothetical protein [Streptomyces spectabilis]|uniref:Uncharacterized protein n=1 Tax=Streptomyces spectabilis TaxID=68270 RepID=A0A5P2X970_STRST|nr:hypothetical protein [Streptomyces spectabilis]QEV59725.1 hypothetical protein CP982_14085 [Streptomyces spectabilis]
MDAGGASAEEAVSSGVVSFRTVSGVFSRFSSSGVTVVAFSDGGTEAVTGSAEVFASAAPSGRSAVSRRGSSSADEAVSGRSDDDSVPSSAKLRPPTARTRPAVASRTRRRLRRCWAARRLRAPRRPCSWGSSSYSSLALAASYAWRSSMGPMRHGG